MRHAEWRRAESGTIGHSSGRYTRNGYERDIRTDERRVCAARPAIHTVYPPRCPPASLRGQRGGLLAGPDDLLAARSDAHQDDRHTDEVGDEAQVVARRRGQLARAARRADVLAPPRQLGVLADGVVKHRLVVGERVEGRVLLAAVARAHLDRREAAEHVELRDDERSHRVDARRVLQRDQIEPSGAPRAAGRRPELAAALADLDPDLVVELGRERARADARRVRLRDAPHLVDVAWTDAGADARRTRDRVRRGHERIRAVVDVEQRALRAFEHDDAAVVERAVRERRRVRDELLEPMAVREVLVAHRLQVQPRVARERPQAEPLGLERGHDLLLEDLLVEHVLHADAQARRLVRVAGPDPALRRADLELAELRLARVVEHQVVGHDQVRVGRHAQAADVDALRPQVVDLVGEDLGVDHDAVADHARLARVEDPARDEVELPRLALAHDRVTGVVAALEADDHVGALGQQVDDLALPLVAPLGANDDDSRHARRSVSGDESPRVLAVERDERAHLLEARHRALADLLDELVAFEVGRDDHRALVLVARVDDRIELLEHPVAGALGADVIDVQQVHRGEAVEELHVGALAVGLERGADLGEQARQRVDRHAPAGIDRGARDDHRECRLAGPDGAVEPQAAARVEVALDVPDEALDDLHLRRGHLGDGRPLEAGSLVLARDHRAEAPRAAALDALRTAAARHGDARLLVHDEAGAVAQSVRAGVEHRAHAARWRPRTRGYSFWKGSGTSPSPPFRCLAMMSSASPGRSVVSGL